MQHGDRRQGRDPAHPRRRRGLCRAGRGAVQPVSARARSRPPVPRRRTAGGDRRVPCERLPVDAAGAAARPAGSRPPGHHPVRWRGRGPHAVAVARHRGRRRQAAVQLPLRHARDGGRHLADPAALGGHPRGRPLRQLRCRARLPVPVQLLHHHQRAGPQVALPHHRRRRGDRARQCGAGHHPLLRHRRQLRAQQQLGADPRPSDRAAREGRVPHPAVPAGRHALPPHSRLHREVGARRLHRRLHRVGEHQPGNP